MEYDKRKLSVDVGKRNVMKRIRMHRETVRCETIPNHERK